MHRVAAIWCVNKVTKCRNIAVYSQSSVST